jgi:hypothetical protein
MDIVVNALYWDSIDSRIVNSHIKVMETFNIPIKYNCTNMRHGLWMDIIMENVSADIYVFFDIDCVPISKDAYYEAINYVKRKKTFIGNAQVSNHIEPKKHIFAAPSFFAISRECYDYLNKPSFLETHRSDVAEELSYVADEKGIEYKCLYPTKFDRISQTDGVWNLSNYGCYGIGTVFENKFYHLFQSRLSSNVDLFEKRCNEIIFGNFNTHSMYDSKNFI